jgi:hypothetical protein
MPNNLEEMYADLEAADTAGDTELATAIADQIRAAEYSASRRADVAPRQAHQRTLPGKLGTGLSDAPMRAWEALKQLGAAIGEGTGMVPEGTVADQTVDMNTRRLLKTGGDPATEEAADIGEVALLSAAPGANALRSGKAATSVLKAFGKTAGVGAAEAALMLPASETAMEPGDVFKERATAAALSAGIIAPVAATAMIKPAAHNWLVRLKQNAKTNEQTLKARREAGGWLDGQTLTVSQQTGNDVAKSLELQVKSTAASNFLNKQTEEMMKRWEAFNRFVGRGSGLKPGDMSFLVAARKLSDAWKDGEQAAQAAASRAYGTQLEQVVELGRLDKSKFPVGFNNLASVTDELAAGSGGRDWWRAIYGPAAEAPAGKIAELDQYLKQIKENPGFTQGLDVHEVVMLRKNLNQLDNDFYEARKRSPNIDPDLLARHSALRKVIRALDADVGAVVAKEGTAASDALKLYKGANQQYSEFKDLQDFMRQTATGQWFGGFQPADAQKFLTQLGGMEPAQQTVLVNTLQNGGEAGQQALHGLRMALVEQALAKARQMPNQAASAGSADLHKLGSALMGDMGPIGSKVFTPAQFAEVKKGLAAIRVLEEAPVGFSVNRAPQIESGTMAAASGSAPFWARMAWRLMGASKVERMLFSPEGLKRLDVLADLARQDPSKPFGVAQRNRAARVGAYMISSGLVAGEVPPEEQAAFAQWVEENGGFEGGNQP